MFSARASYIAGFAGAANVLAGERYGIPIVGTMAHSFVQVHDDEMIAFENFARARPDGLILLIDTYNTEAGARKVVELAPRLTAEGIAIRGVRIDSGDLALHAELGVGGLPAHESTFQPRPDTLQHRDRNVAGDTARIGTGETAREIELVAAFPGVAVTAGYGTGDVGIGEGDIE